MTPSALGITVDGSAGAAASEADAAEEKVAAAEDGEGAKKGARTSKAAG